MDITRTRRLYAVNQLLHYLPIGFISPVLSLYFLSRGLTLSRMGILMALYSVTVLILELPTGGLADRYGRIRIYRISLIFSFLAYSGFLLSRNMTEFLVSAIFMGAGRALSSGTVEAWFMDAHEGLEEKELEKSMAFSTRVATLSLGAGTLAGGLLPDMVSRFCHTGLPQGPYSLNLRLTIFLILINALTAGLLFSPGKAGESHKEQKKINVSTTGLLKKALLQSLSSKELKIMLIITLVFGIALSSIEGLWQPHVKELAPESPSLILGILSAFYFFAAAGGSMFSEKVCRRTGLFQGLFIMKSLMGIILILLGYWGGLAGFGTSYVLLFLIHGIISGPHQVALNRFTRQDIRSSLLSLDSLFFMAGAGAGSFLSGWMAQNLSISSAWLFTGSCLFLSAFLYRVLKQMEIVK